MRGASADLAAVIPALQAAATVGAVVRTARRHVGRVVVVDDGSTDRTASVALEAGAEVLRHERTHGKGAALRAAFETLLPARNPVPSLQAIVTLDADGQHDPDDIPRLVEVYHRERPAVVIGSRAGDFGQMRRRRRAMNRFSVASLRVFAHLDLPDSQSGFRLYDALFLSRLRLHGARYEAEMEALLQAAAAGLPIRSVPIHLPVVDGQASSHYRAFPDTFRIIGVVLAHWLRGGRFPEA
jgi:glycosyltransferase involved in cell wall biosynthesis